MAHIDVTKQVREGHAYKEHRHQEATQKTTKMLMDADAKELLVVPATLGSNWYFEDRVLEIGTSYCAEAMNAVAQFYTANAIEVLNRALRTIAVERGLSR